MADPVPSVSASSMPELPAMATQQVFPQAPQWCCCLYRCSCKGPSQSKHQKPSQPLQSSPPSPRGFCHGLLVSDIPVITVTSEVSEIASVISHLSCLSSKSSVSKLPVICHGLRGHLKARTHLSQEVPVVSVTAATKGAFMGAPISKLSAMSPQSQSSLLCLSNLRDPC